MISIYKLSTEKDEDSITYYSTYPLRLNMPIGHIIVTNDKLKIQNISLKIDTFKLSQRGHFGRKIIYYRNADIDDDFKNYTGFLITDPEGLNTMTSNAMNIKDICDQIEEGVSRGYITSYYKNVVWWHDIEEDDSYDINTRNNY